MHVVVSFAGKKNTFFGPTDKKLWMFEVSRRSLGRAGMCWSQWDRVHHTSKNLGARRWGGGQGVTILWDLRRGGQLRSNPATASRAAVARLPRVVACLCQAAAIFLNFFRNFWWHIFYNFFKPLYVARAWASSGQGGGGVGVQHPIFWCLPLYLEVLILPKFMWNGDFTFFSKGNFLNLEHTWTFISTVGIFVLWKREFTENPTRIASVMEIFCTPL
jgi:hypothetical protein